MHTERVGPCDIARAIFAPHPSLCFFLCVCLFLSHWRIPSRTDWRRYWVLMSKLQQHCTAVFSLSLSLSLSPPLSPMLAHHGEQAGGDDSVNTVVHTAAQKCFLSLSLSLSIYMYIYILVSHDEQLGGDVGVGAKITTTAVHSQCFFCLSICLSIIGASSKTSLRICWR